MCSCEEFWELHDEEENSFVSEENLRKNKDDVSSDDKKSDDQKLKERQLIQQNEEIIDVADVSTSDISVDFQDQSLFKPDNIEEILSDGYSVDQDRSRTKERSRDQRRRSRDHYRRFEKFEREYNRLRSEEHLSGLSEGRGSEYYKNLSQGKQTTRERIKSRNRNREDKKRRERMTRIMHYSRMRNMRYMKTKLRQGAGIFGILLSLNPSRLSAMNKFGNRMSNILRNRSMLSIVKNISNIRQATINNSFGKLSTQNRALSLMPSSNYYNQSSTNQLNKLDRSTLKNIATNSFATSASVQPNNVGYIANGQYKHYSSIQNNISVNDRVDLIERMVVRSPVVNLGLRNLLPVPESRGTNPNTVTSGQPSISNKNQMGRYSVNDLKVNIASQNQTELVFYKSRTVFDQNGNFHNTTQITSISDKGILTQKKEIVGSVLHDATTNALKAIDSGQNIAK